MSPERVRQIEELYHLVCDCAAEDREAFLAQACRGDEELGRRVRALVAQGAGSSPLDKSILRVAARVLDESLAPGVMLGPYRIEDRLGEGGMGTVYAARDTRLGRDVAVKISRNEFSDRFQREARAIAALNHPHICTLYDVGPDYLVMERIEGRPVAGPLRVAEALRVAMQIAAAVRHAHQHGIVHRDLKPANILLAKSGVKVLDFGLAKAQCSLVAAADQAGANALTRDGQIVGTPRYMAPEQLKGLPADQRSDIFAFGAILYEMLTGRPAFAGDSEADVIASVIKSEPEPLKTLQPSVSPALDRLVRVCLAKDPDERYQAMHDVWLQLEWLAAGGAQPRVQLSPRRSRREWLAWGTAIAMAGALVSALVIARHKPAERVPAQFEQPIHWVDWPLVEMPAISPDGRSIAFTEQSAVGPYTIWTRRLDRPEAVRLPGTENGYFPFWSPDSGRVAYEIGGEVWTVEVSGGSPQRLCNAPPQFNGGAWGSGGVILLGSDAGAMYRFSGGAARPFLPLDASRGEKAQAWPQFLPDGRHFLYTSITADGKGGVYAGVLDSPTVHRILDEQVNVNWVEPGYLLFPRGRSLMAQSFDSEQLRFKAAPFLVADEVTRFHTSKMIFASSFNGTLVYWPERAQALDLVPSWRDRKGSPLGTVGAPARYRQAVLSPDEKWLAACIIGPPPLNSNDLWLANLANGIMSLLTTRVNGANWSPDGREVLYTSGTARRPSLYRKPIGGGEERLVYASTSEAAFTGDWLRDGSILFMNLNGLTFSRLRPGQPAAEVLLKTTFRKDESRVSRDGRWVVYNSLESGRWEVYVASFPGFTNRRQVSNRGGVQGYWRQDGRELFYLSLDGDMMAVAFQPGDPPELSAPKTLFHSRVPVSAVADQFAAAGNGERFILLESPGVASSFFTVVVNWPATAHN